MEHWKYIRGYEGQYQVSDLGRIRSLDRIITDKNGRRFKCHGRIVKPYVSKRGYLYLSLVKKDGKKLVHRIVAEAFIANKEGKPNVNHLDGNPLNNRVANLEWCTQSENIKHAYKTGLARQSKVGKIVIDTNTGVFYLSAGEAAKAIGLHRVTMIKKLCGSMKNNTSLKYA